MNEVKEIRDSYERFFSKFKITKKEFFKFGADETLYAIKDRAEAHWKKLKKDIKNNKTVYIRGFGRNSSSSKLYKDFYAYILSNKNVEIDPVGNSKPREVIRELTGYSKTKNLNYQLIRNYQVSHVFGKTKNVYAFTAPWNIVYQPKLIDPFTGHEAKGVLVEDYTKLFQKKSYAQFKDLIDDYNRLMRNRKFKDKIKEYLEDFLPNSTSYEEADIKKLTTSVEEQFAPIVL